MHQGARGAANLALTDSVVLAHSVRETGRNSPRDMSVRASPDRLQLLRYQAFGCAKHRRRVGRQSHECMSIVIAGAFQPRGQAKIASTSERQIKLRVAAEATGVRNGHVI